MAATARIDELRSKFDDNPRRYFASLANEYRKAGDLTTAIAICRTQLRHYPTHMSGHVVLGQALFESGELEAARVAFERAVELDPENLIALRHLGDAAMARHDVESARRWYRRVLEIDAGNDAIATQLLTLEAPPIRVVEPEPEKAAAEPPSAEPPSAELPSAPDRASAPEAEPEPARAAGVLDFDPDELAWPSPASPDIPTASDEVPAFLEAMAPPEPLAHTTADTSSGTLDGPAGEFDFVDGWDTVDVADLSETIEVPIPVRAGSDAVNAGISRTDLLDDPVVGLDLPPVDDAGLRELAHATDAFMLDAEPRVTEAPPVEAGAPIDAPSADAPAEAGAAHEPTVTAASVDTETAPLDEVIASGAFVTETMAELCVQQGHDDEALAIYEQLAAQRPADARLAERLAAVRTRLGRPARPNVSEPAGEYLRALAERHPGRQSTDADDAPAEPPPANAEPAIAMQGAPANPNEPATVSELTLEYPTPVGTDAIEPAPADAADPAAGPDERDRWAAAAWSGAFRADAAPERPLLAHLTPRDTSPDLSFDRFFVGLEEEGAGAEAETAREPEPAPRATAPASPAPVAEQDGDRDLAEFNAWLRGLGDA